jgi:colicin import membrane protein
VSQLVLAHDALLPHPPGGNGPGAALALVVHVGLIAALTPSSDWRSQTPEVFSAEIWASVPQAAAPPPPVAPPAPALPTPRTVAPPTPDADIAIERERQRKTEAVERDRVDRKKAEAERKLAEADRKRLAAEQKQADAARRQAEQEEREAKADDARLARQREENLKRMMGQVGSPGTATGTPGSTGTTAQSAGPSATYAGKVKAQVRPNIVFTGTLAGNTATEVEVTAASGGSIISRRIVKSSGHKDWDEAVLRAIDKTPSLPRDTDGRVPQTLIIAFRPD